MIRRYLQSTIKPWVNCFKHGAEARPAILFHSVVICGVIAYRNFTPGPQLGWWVEIAVMMGGASIVCFIIVPIVELPRANLIIWAGLILLQWW